MKINPDYRLRVIAGENIVIMHGTQGARYDQSNFSERYSQRIMGKIQA